MTRWVFSKYVMLFALTVHLCLVSRTLDKVGLWLMNDMSFHLYLVSRTLDKVGLSLMNDMSFQLYLVSRTLDQVGLWSLLYIV